MVTTKSSLFTCLLLATTLTISLAVVDPVLDTVGQALRLDMNYYIQPAPGMDGGGVTFSKGENNSCPFEVIQAPNVGAKGSPLRLSTMNTTDGTIHVDDDITVEFVLSGITSGCPQSTTWQVDIYRLSTGGADKALFTILKYEDSYVFQFCPRASGCNFNCPRLKCAQIAIEEVNGQRRLVVGRPGLFKIVFHKA